MIKQLFLFYFVTFSVLSVTGNIPGDTLFRFAHVSDTHVGSGTALIDLQATIDDLNSQSGIAFVIITGDITEFGSDEELRTAKTLLERLNKPWYVVPGNHDTKWSESGAASFKTIFGSETFSFDHKGFLFMGTSSGPNMRMGPGQVPREHLVWMDTVLSNHRDKHQPIIFVNHYPINNTLNNWYEVLDRFKDRNLKAILCGHGHSNQKMDFDGVPGVMGRSNLRAKDSIGGYNIVTVTQSAIIYNERKPRVVTLPSWHTVSMDLAQMPTWKTDATRPDYSMNKKYNNVLEKWAIQETADIGSAVAFYKQSVIYTTTDGWIKAADYNSGKQLWSFKSGGKLYATPLVHGTSVIVPSTDGIIYCIGAGDGKRIWTYATEMPIVSSAAAYENSVIVAGSDGHCRALDVRSGDLLWEYDKIIGFTETKPLVDGDKIYFGSWGNEFYSIDAGTGQLIWKWSAGQANRMFSPAACWAVSAGNRVFIVAPDRHMTVLNKVDGAIIWRNYDTSHFVRESMGISRDKRLVYVKTFQGKVQALDAAAPGRKVVWIATDNLGFDVCPSPINEYNGTVFVPSQSGVVYAFDNLDGHLLWKHKLSNCLINTIQPSDKNSAIVSTMDGKLVRLMY